LAEVTVCGRCGTRSWAGVRFCYACGQSLIPNWPGSAPAGQFQAPAAPFQAPGPVAQAPGPVAQAPGPVAQAPAAVPVAVPVAPAVPIVPPAAPQFAPPTAPAAVPPAWPVAAAAPNTGPFSPYAASLTPPAQPWSGTAAPYRVLDLAKPVEILFVAAVEIVIALVGFYVAYDLFTWVNWGINYGDGSEVPLDLVVGVAYFATSSLMFGAVRGLWSLKAWAWTRAFLLNILLIGMIISSVIPWGLNTLGIIGLIANSVMLVCLNLTSTRKLFGRPPLSFLQGAQ
jgi:hypothetical protein